MALIKRSLGLLLVVPLLYALQLNVRMFYTPDVVLSAKGTYNQDLYQQLQFLKSALHDGGAGAQMQQVYPEGYVFLHALYGLSWANAVRYTAEDELLGEALAELSWTIGRLESEQARAVFPEDMFLSYGVFYQGWLNYTRGRYLQLHQRMGGVDSLQQESFQAACARIAAAVERHHTPFLFSYHYGCWPADNVVALATLTWHDNLFAPKYEQLRANWLEAMQQKLDEQGLMPHSADLTYGNAQQMARGSSQSLMLAFWQQIDSAFAQRQYELYKEQFLDHRLGLPGVREYAATYNGRGDIDAGPIIWGIGGSASVVGMGTVAQYADSSTYLGLRSSLEGFGAAMTWRGKKQYLLGQLPMADAFIAWSHSRVPPALWGLKPKPKITTLIFLWLPVLLLGGLIWVALRPKT